MKNLFPFTSGSRGAVHKLNEIVKTADSLNNFIGDGLILINRTINGYVISLNIEALRGVLAHNLNPLIRKAYCKNDAGVGTTLDCYLNTDSTGEEIEVNFSIVDGVNLNGALPRLTDGDLIYIIKIGNEWHCTTLFQAEGAPLIRKAYCKNDAGASSSITCYLDTDDTGDEISVYCSVAGGGNLNSASPRLTDGLLIFVEKFGEDWHCIAPFQTTEDCECI